MRSNLPGFSSRCKSHQRWSLLWRWVGPACRDPNDH